MRKYIHGKYVDMTAEEIAAMQSEKAAWEAIQATRPLTTEEVTRLMIRQQVNSLDINDATASRMVDYFPELTGDGSMVRAGTRINWHGTLTQAAVDLWDLPSNTPDAAPNLWADIPYRSGYRIIPETITVTTAFSDGEYGWWGDTLYRSKVNSNVYTPEQYPDNWEAVSL